MLTHRLNKITAGRVLMSLGATVAGVGPYLADWNETHIHNPNWPPHAKFHNAQTMSMGLALCGTTLYHLWKRDSHPQQHLTSAAITGSMYWLTQISALAYPGSASVDPPQKARYAQAVVAIPALTATALGYALERRRTATVRAN